MFFPLLYTREYENITQLCVELLDLNFIPELSKTSLLDCREGCARSEHSIDLKNISHGGIHCCLFKKVLHLYNCKKESMTSVIS